MISYCIFGIYAKLLMKHFGFRNFFVDLKVFFFVSMKDRGRFAFSLTLSSDSSVEARRFSDEQLSDKEWVTSKDFYMNWKWQLC